jgi:hypothetical protein
MLPHEILYTIVDEFYAAGYNFGAGNPLKNLSETCHALAAYCRPLALRSLAVQSFPPGAGHSVTHAMPAGPPAATVKAFTKLVAQHSQLLNAVVHLHLDLRIQPPFWVSTPAQSSSFPEKEWLLLFGLHLCQLKTLKLSFPALDDIPEEVLSPMLQFLLRADSLESLALVTTGALTASFLRFVPESVKDLAVNGRCWIDPDGTRLPTRRPLPIISPRVSLPRLASLSLTRNCGFGYRAMLMLAGLGPGQVLGIDLNQLRHIQLPTPEMPSSYERIYRALISLSASSLQCIHIGYQVEGHGPLTPLLGLERYTLPSLRCLEVSARWDKQTLRHALGWLSTTVLSAKSPLALKGLKVSILATPISRDAAIPYSGLWREMCHDGCWPIGI